MDKERLRDLVESTDLDGLVRFVDIVVDQRDWDGLVAVRDRCREAVERGKQLWGVADFVEYRLALDAPARLRSTSSDRVPAASATDRCGRSLLQRTPGPSSRRSRIRPYEL